MPALPWADSSDAPLQWRLLLVLPQPAAARVATAAGLLLLLLLLHGRLWRRQHSAEPVLSYMVAASM